jgi:hypothetical protein
MESKNIKLTKMRKLENLTKEELIEIVNIGTYQHNKLKKINLQLQKQLEEQQKKAK